MIEFFLRRWHRLRQPRMEPVPPLRPVSLSEPDARVEALLATRPLLLKVLKENIIPFWMECADPEEGGYRVNHDHAGRWKGPADKATIPQARLLWFFSRAVRAGYLPEGLSLARHGFRFLKDRLWDSEFGGFVWSVSHDGTSVIDGSKRLYAHAFAAYGLAEYARIEADPEAASLAGEAVRTLDDRFRDRRNGGFRAELGRAWEAPKPGTPAAARSSRKTVNDHIHVLEAMGALHALEAEPWVRDRMLELILILTGTALRKAHGVCTDGHGPDWTPAIGRGGATVSYGHDLESIGLVMDACEAVGIPLPLVSDWGRSLADHALRWGWDKRRGGMYLHGPVGGPAHDRAKVWWVQAETLVGALRLYRVTGDARYADLYLETLRWIEDRHLDWTGGDWHALVQPGGTTTGDKAGLWKSPYHNGRAMIRCLELLTPGDPLDGEAAESHEADRG